MKICKIKNCNRILYAKGLCHTHYCYKLQFGFLRRKKPNKEKICKVKNCSQTVRTKGYCSLHYIRKRYNRQMAVPKNWGCRGKRNAMWKGGISEYPNHYLLKKNRLIVLKKYPKCEKCGKPSVEVRHRNGDKSDQRQSNLMSCCHRCSCLLRHKKNNSKYRRLYGKTLKELGKKFNMNYVAIRYRIINKISLRRKKRGE